MNDQSTSLFGLFDGMTSTLGMILTLALFGSIQTLVMASVASAVCSGASMAAGEWQSDSAGSLHRAVVMGITTLLGCLLPAVPLFVDHRWPGYVCCGVIVALLGGLIAHLRPIHGLRSWVQTFLLLIGVTGLGVLTGWLS